MLEHLIGQVVDDKYRIERQLGEGGMGAVYQAVHIGTERPVALKIVAPRFMANPEFIERFKREAKAAGRLHHPNVVNVTDFGFAYVGSDRLAYLVMEYLDGCSLAELLKEETNLPLRWIVDILEQVCSAIDEAHQRGVLHRDLKPDNIWLEPNRRGGYTVKVLDFGLAKLGDTELSPGASPVFVTRQLDYQTLNLSHSDPEAITMIPSVMTEEVNSVAATLLQNDSTVEPGGRTRQLYRDTADNRLEVQTAPAGELTRVGMVLGTPQYMSPEQCRGHALDTRSDIYSLGVVAYQLLTGSTPFNGDINAVLRAQMEAPPPPLETYRTDIPRRVRELVMSALAKNPAHRPASAAAFAGALRANAEGTGLLLRQAISLYSEHFPTFLKIAVIGHIPLIAIDLLQMATQGMITKGMVSHPMWNILAWCLSILAVFSDFFADTVISGVFVPVVAQLLVMPMRPVQVRVAFAALGKRLHAFLTTALLFYAMLFIRLIPFVVPALLAYVNFSLYAPVVMMETEQGMAALKRSKELVSRVRPTVVILMLIYLLISSELTSGLSQLFIAQMTRNMIANTMVLDSLSKILTTALNILINPLISISFALVYFKACQAGGETLIEALKKYETEYFPQSHWQKRMHEFIRAHISSR